MKQSIFTRLAAGLVMVTAVFFSTSAGIRAQEPPAGEVQSKVTYVSITQLFGLKPDTLVIQPGGTVIWLNQSSDDIEVVFTARQVALSCVNPTNFHVSGDGFFVSNTIQPKAVASLCFIESGGFDYVVTWKNAGKNPDGTPRKPLAGRIIVED